MSTFSAINTAMSGLQAQQAALEVTGQNVANVNTPGYHRQEAVLASRPPASSAAGTFTPFGALVGNGVEVTTIRRMQSQYVQQQMQSAQGQVGYWTTTQSNLQQIEATLSPGTGSDLSSMLDSFFTAWQGLASNPEQATLSDGVRAAGINLATALNSAAAQLDTASATIDDNLVSRVDRLNSLADQVADLNAQIAVAKSSGHTANDLQDQRATLMQEMGTLAGVSSLSSDEGSSIVNIGGRPLVQGTEAYHLKVAQGDGGAQIVWEDDGASAKIQSGEMGALLNVRDQVIPGYTAQLDGLASALATAVNTLHRQGMVGTGQQAGDFFTGTTAGSIQVSDAIRADASQIASSRVTGVPGDGGLATDIAALSRQALIGKLTLNQSAQYVVGQIGTAVKSAKTNQQANNAALQQYTTQEQAVSGVSLDEEMANLLVYQRAYDASAKVVSVADAMLQTLLEHMG